MKTKKQRIFGLMNKYIKIIKYDKKKLVLFV